MVSQTAERVDTKYDKDLTENFVYGANFPNGNLLLVDLQRQDEAGFRNFEQFSFKKVLIFSRNPKKYELNTYDNIRNGFMGMEPLEDILPFGPFRTFYEDADRDFYVGGLIESEQEGDLGELFSTIILEQFLRLRDSGNVWMLLVNMKITKNEYFRSKMV